VTDETVSGPPEGEALPESAAPPLPADWLARPASPSDRVLVAIDAWYADHFHRCAVAGTAPLPAAEKALLAEHVTAALSTDSKE
jgi:hypothetical protein